MEINNDSRGVLPYSSRSGSTISVGKHGQTISEPMSGLSSRGNSRDVNLPSLHEKHTSSLLLTPKLVGEMIDTLLSIESNTNQLDEIVRHATNNPEIFQKAIFKMITDAGGAEEKWNQAVAAAKILDLPASSRYPSVAGLRFADQLELEINTQRMVRDISWQVNNAGFGQEGFSLKKLDFSRYSLPINPLVTQKALQKLVSPEGPFGSFGLDLALKFSADTGLHDLHEKFSSYKEVLTTSNLVKGQIDYRAGTDNHHQNGIRHTISPKIAASHPVYNTLIQLFMMPNSLLPDDQAKRAFLEKANTHYVKFVNNLPFNSSADTKLSNNYPLLESEPMQNLVKDMLGLIKEHFDKHNLTGKLPNLLSELAAGGTSRMPLTLPEHFRSIVKIH